MVGWSGAIKYEVYWNDMVLLMRESYIIRLVNNSCSCGKWDKSSIPCQYTMVAIAFHGVDPFTYRSEWFKKETYMRAYQFTISSIKGMRFGVTSEESLSLPPVTKRIPG